MIGERVNSPEMSSAEVARWRKAWRIDPIRAMRTAPSMIHGPTRDRLLDITSIKPRRVQVVNLLPPDNECGTWDKELAEWCAVHVLTWLSRPGCDWRRVFMLGKRVSRELTDQPKCEFGRVYDLCGVPALCFPHPSGRSHFFNGDEYKAQARYWARKFLRGI
jgi:hypothetical protein